MFGKKLFALAVGIVCHVLFGVAVWSMGVGIYTGLAGSPHSGLMTLAFDLLLLAQFPLLHSWLLTKQGRTLLLKLSPADIAPAMVTTWFAMIASIQLIVAFRCWIPIGNLRYSPHGYLLMSSNVLYGLSWMFLAKTMFDADITLQSGFKGWWAVFRGKKPTYAMFPQHGSFRVCRQPIYLAFALILWTAPVWSVDRILLVSAWSAYCLLGPRFKEARYINMYGDSFRRYQARVPYFFPRPTKTIS